MNRQEYRAAASLAGVFSVRLLGLFMIYPVFEAYAQGLSGATPFLIGLTLGAYGLSQGLLQIPFGLLSDRFGRKTMIAAGLALFALGSVVAALSTSIEGVLIGRILQGTGAVGSVILALVADLTREETRTRAMALVGITIGLSFLVAMVTGPLIASLVGVPGIFWLMVLLAGIGVAIVVWGVPTPRRPQRHRDAGAVPAMLGSVLANRELLRLDFGIFALHAILTSSFLVVPQLLRDSLGLSSQEQWLAYLPILVASVVLMVPAILVAERHRRMKPVFVGAVVLLVASQVALLAGGTGSALLVVGALVAFFAAFNTMEAALPSLVTKAAPAGAKGTATGVFSSAQFIGIFAGGAVGGWMHQAAGAEGVLGFALAVAALWLLVAATMPRPAPYSTRLARIGEVSGAEADALVARLARLAGVVDVVVVAEERVAYLKVDQRTFDAAALEAALGRA